MDLKRGNIVIAAGVGDYAGKPRPFLIVQSDVFNADHSSVTLCPITSMVGGNHLFRVALSPSIETNLLVPSEVQVDKMLSMRRERIVRIIGAAPVTSMTGVDDALRRWLQL